MTDEMKRFSVTMPVENAEWIDENYHNRSGFINDLVERARSDDSTMERVVTEYQLEQLRGEKTSVEARLETIENRIERLEDRLDGHVEHRNEALDEALDEMEEHRLTVDTDHVVIETLAREQFGGDCREALDALVEWNQRRDDPLPEARFE